MTETAIVQRQSGGVVAREEFSRQQVELIRQTLMPGANDNELALYLEYAKRTGLDPFAKQLIPIRTWDRDNNRYRWEFMAGIDGLRLVAQRTGDYDGFEGPFFRGKGGEWTDFWDGDGPPAECKFIVYRKGAARGFPGRVKYTEFVRKNRKGEVYGPWLTQPEHMLRIRAESHALRAAFPRETSGLYLREDGEGELHQPPPQIVNPDAPATDPQKGQLHKLATQLGWDEDTYRNELERATGKRSSKDLTKGAAHETITAWTLLYETGEVATEDIEDGELVEDVDAAVEGDASSAAEPSVATGRATGHDAAAASAKPQGVGDVADPPPASGKSGRTGAAGNATPARTAAPPDASYPPPCEKCGSRECQQYEVKPDKDPKRQRHTCHDCGWSSGWVTIQTKGAGHGGHGEVQSVQREGELAGERSGVHVGAGLRVGGEAQERRVEQGDALGQHRPERDERGSVADVRAGERTDGDVRDGVAAHQFEGNPDDNEPCAACGKPFGAAAHHAKQGKLG